VLALFILLLAGFKGQPWEAYFARYNSWRAYFARLTLQKLLGTLKVLASSLLRGLLCEACFMRVKLGDANSARLTLYVFLSFAKLHIELG
jgi:hypothetical protein